MLISDGLGYYRGLGDMQFLFIDIFKGESGWTKVFSVPPTPSTIDSVGNILENTAIRWFFDMLPTASRM